MPPLAVTTIGKKPGGVALVVAMVRVTEQLGGEVFWMMHEGAEKLAVAPGGSPATDWRPEEAVPKEMKLPWKSLAVMVVDPDWPWVNTMLPEFVSVNGIGGEICAAARRGIPSETSATTTLAAMSAPHCSVRILGMDRTRGH